MPIYPGIPGVHRKTSEVRPDYAGQQIHNGRGEKQTMKRSFLPLKDRDYAYYVYCGPGHIEYFTADEYSTACEIARKFETDVQEMQYNQAWKQRLASASTK
jgi:hypothetical protein